MLNELMYFRKWDATVLMLLRSLLYYPCLLSYEYLWTTVFECIVILCLVHLSRDHSCTIFFLYGRIGSRFDSCAGHQSGVNTVQADYRGSHILMNNGSWVDFSKSVCYSTIYTHFVLIMTMSLKILSDN